MNLGHHDRLALDTNLIEQVLARLSTIIFAALHLQLQFSVYVVFVLRPQFNLHLLNVTVADGLDEAVLEGRLVLGSDYLTLS